MTALGKPEAKPEPEKDWAAESAAIMRALIQLEKERKELLEKLAEADQHVRRGHLAKHAPDRVTIPGATGDAGLIAGMTRGRLLDIIEDHWRVHHMGMPEAFRGMNKQELVNYVCELKGLSGSYKKKLSAARKATTPHAGGAAPRRNLLTRAAFLGAKGGDED